MLKFIPPFLKDAYSALLVAMLLALFVRTWGVEVFRVPSDSMEPGLLAGDLVLVNKFIFSPSMHPLEKRLLPIRSIRQGERTVFKWPLEPEREFIKRCVGLPGEQIEIVDKNLFIDGESIGNEPYVVHRDPRVYDRTLLLDDAFRKRDNFGPFIVPEDHLFCLGDNRDNAYDSRFWGPVPRSYVKGSPVLRIWRKNTPVANFDENLS